MAVRLHAWRPGGDCVDSKGPSVLSAVRRISPAGKSDHHSPICLCFAFSVLSLVSAETESYLKSLVQGGFVDRWTNAFLFLSEGL